MDVVLARVADPFVIPTSTSFSILFPDGTFPQVFGTPNDHDRLGRFWCYCEDVVDRVGFVV